MNYESSIQTVSWFHDRYREGSLTISPPYQRKPVWAARQKCYLIESILLGLPVPEVFVQQKTSPEGKTTCAIVDGQQRIRTILQFIGSEVDPGEQEYNKFRLDKLDVESPLRDLGFADLSADQKKAFFGYRFVVRYLNTESDDEVRDMFRRLNKFLTPLKPQELRNATYNGPFVRLVLHLADSEYWAENRIVTPSSIRRMGDVEFVSELLIGVMHGPQGGSSRVIDDYYKQYEDYEEEFPSQRRTERLFEDTLGAVQSILPEIKQTRWGNKTDFYTLFVAVANLLKTSELTSSKFPQARKSVLAFAAKVDERLADETVEVENEVMEYVRAVEKGANDKARRAARYAILVALMEPFFRAKKSLG
jgi:hypothetical protein